MVELPMYIGALFFPYKEIYLQNERHLSRDFRTMFTNHKTYAKHWKKWITQRHLFFTPYIIVNAFTFVAKLVVSKKHYGSRLMFVDAFGEAAYGFVTKVKGPIVTLKPSQKSDITIIKQRVSLSVMEAAENVKVDDHVLVYQSDSESYNSGDVKVSCFIPEGSEDDRFQNLFVLKVTRVCDDCIYGDCRSGMGIMIPSSYVFKIPEDWPWSLAPDSSIESGPCQLEANYVTEEHWEQLNEVPEGIESMKTESSETTVTTNNSSPSPCDPLSCDPLCGESNNIYGHLPEEVLEGGASMKAEGPDTIITTDNSDPTGHDLQYWDPVYEESNQIDEHTPEEHYHQAQPTFIRKPVKKKECGKVGRGGERHYPFGSVSRSKMGKKDKGVISKQHYGSRLLFVDNYGEAAYGFVTKVKGRMVTLKPSQKSDVSITRQRGSLSMMKTVEDVNINDHVLVCLSDNKSCDESDVKLSYFIPDGCIDDKFQNLTVLRVTRACDDYVYGNDRTSSEIKVPTSHVFKIPEDWPWILASDLKSDYEPIQSNPNQDTIKEESSDQQLSDQVFEASIQISLSGSDDHEAAVIFYMKYSESQTLLSLAENGELPNGIESIKEGNSDNNNNGHSYDLQSCDLANESANENSSSQSHGIGDVPENRPDLLTLFKQEDLLDYR